jgi:hypothetical protein
MKGYQHRPDEVADAAWRRGHMTPLELFRVAAWKTGLGLGQLTLNSQTDIEQATGKAIDGIREWREKQLLGLDDDACWDAWQKTANSVIGIQHHCGLLALEGVGYRMATSILDILDPKVWPVIDRWATQTVFGRPLDWYGAAPYAAYARHLATVGHACWPEEPTINALDQRAMRTAGKRLPLPQGWTYAMIPKRSS